MGASATWGVSPIFGHVSIVLLLIVHMLLGYRELRHLRYYQNDPLVCRLLGLKHLPDVATVSRALSTIDGVTTNEQFEHRIMSQTCGIVSIRIATGYAKHALLKQLLQGVLDFTWLPVIRQAGRE